MGRIDARVVAAVAGLATTLTLGGCGQSAATTAAPAATPAASSSIPVVASTDVWGDIAAQVGGSTVHVTSVITDPAADPHAYEADARTQLAVSRARVVIENGGGYDDFMARLLTAADSKATVIDAVDVSGKAAEAKAAGTDLNEHVWYDLPTVGKVADRIAAALSAADPQDAASFRANAGAFHAKLDALITDEQTDQLRTAGAGVAITEPVPLYLLQALGAVDKTPPEFSHAVEDGADVPPALLRQTTALFSSGAVKALVYNAQTSDVQTAEVRKAAESAHVAVVPVTETLPRGTSYLTWMSDNLAAISKALAP